MSAGSKGGTAMAAVSNGIVLCEDGISEDAIVRAHDARIKGFARRFPFNDRDDFVQIGRMALIRAARIWRQQSQLWTYASREVFGAMLAHAKKRRLESFEVLVEDIEEVTNEGDPNANSPYRANGLTSEPFVIDLLPSLDPSEKEVIVLSLEGFGVEEIAEKLGRSKSDVWRIYHRAAGKMRERLMEAL